MGFAQADNAAIAKIATLLLHKKKDPRLRGDEALLRARRSRARGLKDRSSGKPVFIIVIAFFTGG